MARSGRRHYRVAQKEIEATKCEKNCGCEKNKIIAIVIGVVAIAFVKGLVFGYLANRK